MDGGFYFYYAPKQNTTHAQGPGLDSQLHNKQRGEISPQLPVYSRPFIWVYTLIYN